MIKQLVLLVLLVTLVSTGCAQITGHEATIYRDRTQKTVAVASTYNTSWDWTSTAMVVGLNSTDWNLGAGGSYIKRTANDTATGVYYSFTGTTYFSAMTVDQLRIFNVDVASGAGTLLDWGFGRIRKLGNLASPADGVSFQALDGSSTINFHAANVYGKTFSVMTIQSVLSDEQVYVTDSVFIYDLPIRSLAVSRLVRPFNSTASTGSLGSLFQADELSQAIVFFNTSAAGTAAFLQQGTMYLSSGAQISGGIGNFATLTTVVGQATTFTFSTGIFNLRTDTLIGQATTFTANTVNANILLNAVTARITTLNASTGNVQYWTNNLLPTGSDLYDIGQTPIRWRMIAGDRGEYTTVTSFTGINTPTYTGGTVTIITRVTAPTMTAVTTGFDINTASFGYSSTSNVTTIVYSNGNRRKMVQLVFDCTISALNAVTTSFLTDNTDPPLTITAQTITPPLGVFTIRNSMDALVQPNAKYRVTFGGAGTGAIVSWYEYDL